MRSYWKNLNRSVFLLQEQAWLDLFRIRFIKGFKYLQVKNSSLHILGPRSQEGNLKTELNNQILSVKYKEGELLWSVIILISKMWKMKECIRYT